MARAKADDSRAKALAELFGKCVDETTACVTFNDFAGLFPTLLVEHRDVLFDIYGQVVQDVKSNANHEFGVLCAAYGVAEKLGRLDALCREHGVTAADTACGEDNGSTDGTLAEGEMPLAAARAQRVSAKEAEKKVLLEMLAQAKEARAAKQALVDERRRAVAERAAQCAPMERLKASMPLC